MTAQASGAHLLLSSAHAMGVRVCFANPGTTELAIVRALDSVEGIRPILGLFEGVCTGAADGYGRLTGVPALTLLHLGPGFANGLANLHNARRAHTPIINIIGDHATWHLRYDAPLTSDISKLAMWVSSQVIQVRATEEIPRSVRMAMEDACKPPGSPVTLIAPSDIMEAPAAGMARGGEAFRRAALAEVSSGMVSAAAQAAAKGNAVLLLGGNALGERGQIAAARIAAATGARLVMESYPAIASCGGGLPRVERLAYFPQDVLSQLGSATVVLAGARAPVSYFGYPGEPSELVARERLIELSQPGEDAAQALEHLAELLPAGAAQITPSPESEKPALSGALTPAYIAEAVVAEIAEGTIVSIEGSTCGGPYLQRAHRARRHRVMTNTGGAIGQGIPCGLGAAIAEPASRVVCVQSDGSAQYTLQALWTMAREALDITVIICANHRYGILQTELRRAGAHLDGKASASMTRLDSPRVDWVSLARGYGVPALRADAVETFRSALQMSLHTTGPYLIECELP
ncbi:MAG TPA: acetolactate synthase large subunit [Steroidobacteraceae bacterium]